MYTCTCICVCVCICIRGRIYTHSDFLTIAIISDSLAYVGPSCPAGFPCVASVMFAFPSLVVDLLMLLFPRCEPWNWSIYLQNWAILG